MDDRFYLSAGAVADLHAFPHQFGFDGFGALVYYRTYSRLQDDGSASGGTPRGKATSQSTAEGILTTLSSMIPETGGWIPFVAPCAASPLPYGEF